jgi:large subunit ribosomal protein L1
MSLSKKYKENLSKYDSDKEYSLDQAVELLHSFDHSKFDESVDISVNLGVDPKHADQLVRGTVSLPNGTGKKVRVVVIAKDDEKNKKAKELGAIESGSDDLVDKIKKGWIDFDVMIASPEMMAEVGKLGRVLGPRGLMPNPKVGTVTPDVEKAVTEIIAGKVEYRVDKAGIISVSVGRVSFDKDKLVENIRSCMNAILKSKPSSVKGTYFKKFTVSSTMSPGLKVLKSDFVN